MEKVNTQKKQIQSKKLRGLHICPISINSGDIYLADAAQIVLSKNDIIWKKRDARLLVTDSDISKFNANYDFILLGPGGILMLDGVNGKGVATLNKMSLTDVLNVSGYQWLIRNEQLDSIKIPILVFSIGWNYFNGLFPKKEPFSSSVSKLIEKSSYFSMRHTGDIIDTTSFIGNQSNPPSLCFCPTLVSSGNFYLHDNLKKIGFQVAFDRPKQRYSNPEEFFHHLHRAMLRLERKGYSIDVIDQCTDKTFISWLKEKKLWKSTFTEVSLKGKSYSFQQNYYNTLHTIFATRGHAQMIPMGLGVRVVSIISHNKIKYFLQDTGLSSTGILINDVTVDSLMEKFLIAEQTDFESAIKHVRENIDSEVKKMRKIITGG